MTAARPDCPPPKENARVHPTGVDVEGQLTIQSHHRQIDDGVCARDGRIDLVLLPDPRVTQCACEWDIG